MKKTKILATSFFLVAICFVLIIGATLALFTSKSNVNIAATSGKVEVVATIDEDSVQTKQLGKEYQNGLNGTYMKAISLDAETGTVTLDKFVPGDGVKFNINIKNNSDVTVKYRTKVTNEGGEDLFNALDVTFDGGQTKWATLKAGGSNKTVNVAIELSEDAENIAQDQTMKLMFTVEAVQGNAEVAPVVTNADDLVKALQDETVKEIELTSGAIDLSGVQTGSDYGIRIERPVTIYGAGNASVLKFGNTGTAISGQADLMIASSNVTLRDFTVVAGHTSDKGVDTIKVTTVGSENDLSDITLENVTVKAGKGHAINVHGAKNVTIDGCTLSDYGKGGISMARAEGVTVKNTAFLTSNLLWGDIGLMYADKTGYETPSKLILGEGNTLSRNRIYSERPESAPGGKDTVEGADLYGTLVHTANGWYIATPESITAANVQNVINGAEDGAVVKFAADSTMDITKCLSVPAGKNITLDGNGSTITGDASTLALGNDKALIYVYTGSSVTIKNFTFEITGGKAQAVVASGDVVLENCKTTDSDVNHMVYINSTATDVTIRNCSSSRPLANLTEKSETCTVLIEGNEYSSWSLFDVYPVTCGYALCNVTFKNNHGTLSSQLVRLKNVTKIENVVFEGNTYGADKKYGALFNFNDTTSGTSEAAVKKAIEDGNLQGVQITDDGKYVQAQVDNAFLRKIGYKDLIFWKTKL